jgi:hypothetical protein
MQERRSIYSFKCVNKVIPHRTRQEYRRQYERTETSAEHRFSIYLCSGEASGDSEHYTSITEVQRRCLLSGQQCRAILREILIFLGERLVHVRVCMY